MRYTTHLLSSSINNRITSLFTKPFSSPFIPQRASFSSVNVEPILLEAYQKHIKPEDHFCLNNLEKKWVAEKPFKGKKILINMHMTLITLTMIRILIRGGAQVEVTASSRLALHENALSAVKEAQLPFHPQGDIPEEKQKKYFDLVFDCGGVMLNKVIPQFGMVELTHTPEDTYSDSKFPVITVDKSKVKEIETGFGTGDALVRVLINLAKKSIAMVAFGFAEAQQKKPEHFAIQVQHSHYLMSLLGLMNIKCLFENQQYLIFGYGKVGKGIASGLTSAGAKKENILIVDIRLEAFMSIREDGYQGLHLDTSTPSNLTASIEKIKKYLNNIYAAITATGIPNAVSRYFEQDDFKKVPLLINMGTPDEWGSNFSDTRIVYKKKAANFMLEYPTEVPYLDPIFSLLLRAGEELISQPGLAPGLHAVSRNIDKAVLASWMHQHGEKIWQHTKTQDKIGELLDVIKRNPEIDLAKFKSIFNDFGIFNSTDPVTPSSCGAVEDPHPIEEADRNGVSQPR